MKTPLVSVADVMDARIFTERSIAQLEENLKQIKAEFLSVIHNTEDFSRKVQQYQGRMEPHISPRKETVQFKPKPTKPVSVASQPIHRRPSSVQSEYHDRYPAYNASFYATPVRASHTPNESSLRIYDNSHEQDNVSDMMDQLTDVDDDDVYDKNSNSHQSRQQDDDDDVDLPEPIHHAVPRPLTIAPSLHIPPSLDEEEESVDVFRPAISPSASTRRRRSQSPSIAFGRRVSPSIVRFNPVHSSPSQMQSRINEKDIFNPILMYPRHPSVSDKQMKRWNSEYKQRYSSSKSPSSQVKRMARAKRAFDVC